MQQGNSHEEAAHGVPELVDGHCEREDLMCF